MEKIRFGIVGIGMMGRMHATSLQRNPYAEVVAVCARTESKVKAFQEEFGVPYGYTNVDELVNNPEVDAIVVATGADAHKAPCLAACNDYDNGFSLTKFDNNTTAYIQVGRTATCSHVESEIVGTKGTLRVNSVPRKNYLSQFTENGFVEECQESFLARWGEAFQAEIDDFVDCVRTGRKPETTAHDGTMSLKFCLQLHQAYLDGKKK